MKKLLIVVPTLEGGGQERVASRMAAIMSADYDVTVAIFEDRNTVYSVDCELINLNIPAAPGTLKKVRNALKRAAALRKLRRERQIDYCVSVGPAANLANVLSNGRGKAICRTSSYLDCEDAFLNRYLFRHCDKVICLTETIRAKLQTRFFLSKEKTAVVYNPLDVNTVLKHGEEAISDYTFSKFTIVSVGRFHWGKNFPRLIKAFSLIKAKIPDAQLLIIGEGGLRAQLEALIAHYDLQNSVTLLGFRKNPFAYLKRARVFVLSSYREGFPNAMVEAMCFLPVVAVDCKSGPREILSSGASDTICSGIEEADYGILVRPAEAGEPQTTEITEDDRILAEAILLLLNDPQKREDYRKRATERAKEFSYERFRESMLRVLNE